MIVFGNKHSAHPKGKYLTQVHGNKVIVVTDQAQKTDEIEADALVTAISDINLCIKTADCVPILLQTDKAVAAIHAGWRGAYSGVIQNTVKAIRQIDNDNLITAFIGPCIRQENYDVDNDFKAKFIEQNPENKQFFDRLKFDLSSYCKNILRELEITQIHDECIDTYLQSDNYFSYRYYTKNKLELRKDERQVATISLS